VPQGSQVLRFDGTAWAPASLGIMDVGGLSGGYLDLSGNQTIGGTKTFTSAPTFGAPLGIASGGTGATSVGANVVFAGPVSGSGAPGFRGLVTADLAGLGPGLVGLNADELASGTVPSARLSGTYGSALTFSNSANSFTGSGSGLTALNASELSSGTLPSARLSGTYGSALTFSSAANSFAGDGASLANLSASALAGGTVPDGRLAGTYSSALTLSHTGNVLAGSLSGTFAGTGSGTFSGTFNGTVNGTLVAASTAGDVTGAIRFANGHFQGFDGSQWLNLDNIPPPIVDALSPSYGSTAGGATVTVTGSNFQALATVTIGGAACTSVAVASTTQLTCATPSSATVGAKDVKVTNPDFQSTTKAGAFEYRRPPAITGFSPSIISTAGGKTVTVTGTDFVGTPTVQFNGSGATVTSAGSTQIVVTAPAVAAGATTLTVVNPDGLSGTGAGPTAQVFVAASGGTVTNVGGYRIHTFTGSGTFAVATGGSVEYLVVAGGGSGGVGGANTSGGTGGGGAGGVLTGSVTVTAQSYSITVGEGAPR